MQDTDRERSQLMARFGPTVSQRVHLRDVAFKPISSGRRAEVCMVIRRRNGLLLTARKSYYPAGITRLLTGGIEAGETVYAALMREIQEETNLQTSIVRLLAIVDYVHDSSPAPLFVSYAFLLNEHGGDLMSNDPAEQLEEFLEVPFAGLPQLANQLDRLPADFHPEIAGNWQAWGAFRSPLHHLIAQYVDIVP